MTLGKTPDEGLVIQGEEHESDLSKTFEHDAVYPCILSMCGSAGCIMVVNKYQNIQNANQIFL